jgi:hypothetical protein
MSFYDPGWLLDDLFIHFFNCSFSVEAGIVFWLTALLSTTTTPLLLEYPRPECLKSFVNAIYCAVKGLYLDATVVADNVLLPDIFESLS